MAIIATAETLGHTLSSGAAELMAEDLADYSVSDIAASLQACRRELTTKLTLAAILQRVQAADGRPEPNEAWSIALASADEADSVVMTEEIGLAMGAARAVLEAGDKIGARMAFLSAYTRFVDTARREARPVKWSLSMGYDPQRRLVAVEEGLRLGRLSAPAAQEYVAQLTHQPITSDGLAIAGLLTGEPVAPPSESIREKWQGVKQAIQQRAAERKAEREADVIANLADMQRRRQEHADAVAELQEQRQ